MEAEIRKLVKLGVPTVFGHLATLTILEINERGEVLIALRPHKGRKTRKLTRRKPGRFDNKDQFGQNAGK